MTDLRRELFLPRGDFPDQGAAWAGVADEADFSFEAAGPFGTGALDPEARFRGYLAPGKAGGMAGEGGGDGVAEAEIGHGFHTD